LLIAAADAINVNIFCCFPKWLESCIMWIDPNFVSVKTSWSYSNKETEEVLYSKVHSLKQNHSQPPLQIQNQSPTKQKTLHQMSPSPISQNKLKFQLLSQYPLPHPGVQQGYAPNIIPSTLGKPAKTSNNLSKTEKLLWRQFCGNSGPTIESNIEPNRILA